MKISFSDVGADEDLAREILAIGRTIAPCLNTLEWGDDARDDAVSILRRVYKTAAARGSQMVKSQRLGGASVEYADVADVFEGQPTRALRALCAEVSGRPQRGHSVGVFPAARPISRVWPEG